MYWRRPLTRLESALYALVVAILIGVFLERSFFYVALAERTAMEVTVQRINTGLRLRRAADLVAGKPSPAAAPQDLFAFAFLAAPPAGPWRYDPGAGELAYGTARFRLVRDATGLWVLAPF